MAKKMEKLARYYSGLVGLKKAPDAIFMIDAKKEHISATEARGGNVPVIAVINSDSDIMDSLDMTGRKHRLFAARILHFALKPKASYCNEHH